LANLASGTAQVETWVPDPLSTGTEVLTSARLVIITFIICKKIYNMLKYY
jgi:hypothetical protein